jgi:hypothetical protein
VVLTIVVAMGSMFSVAFWKKPEIIPQVLDTWGRTEIFLRIISVLVLIPAVTALGMLDKISGETAIAVLSAVAGYVLGRSSAGGTSSH